MKKIFKKKRQFLQIKLKKTSYALQDKELPLAEQPPQSMQFLDNDTPHTHTHTQNVARLHSLNIKKHTSVINIMRQNISINLIRVCQRS